MTRRIALIVLVAGLALPVAGCSSFDPTDLTDFLNTKKPLPGERRPVFPEGVPGVSQGVPPELTKGAQAETAPAEPAKEAAVEPPPAPKARPKAPARPKQAARPASPPAPAPAQQSQSAQQAQPQPTPARQPPVEANWPTIPPAGSFSR